MYYRTRTYIAADWDGDRSAVDQLHYWNESQKYGLTFSDAHDLMQARDGSLNCNIKRSLKTRMDASKTFVLIVGEKTTTVRSGSCAYCQSYNSYSRFCARGHYVDYCSYIEYECKQALEAARVGNMKIIVLYNAGRVDRNKCPEALRFSGNHVAMWHWQNNQWEWDYTAIKNAML